MKNKNYFWEDLPKKQKQEAIESSTGATEQPPQFNLGFNTNQNEQPIQAMFPNSKMMGLDSGWPNVSNSPAPAPTPIPYPTMSNSVPEMPKGKFGTDMSKMIKMSGMTGMGGMGGMTGMGVMGLTSVPLSGPVGFGGGFGRMGPLSGFGGSMFGSPGPVSKRISTHPATYIDMVKSGHKSCKKKAYFQNVRIHASTAIGTPGCLRCPSLEGSLKKGKMSKLKGDDKRFGNAVAKGVGKNFDQYIENVTVSGLPWYPSFASYPGHFAPPTPNVPTPLVACPSSMLSKITSSDQLESSIWSALPSDLQVEENSPVVQAIAHELASYFLKWVISQMVVNVLGKGPVPSYSPPAVPAGPVIGGDVIGIPGHLP